MTKPITHAEAIQTIPGMKEWVDVTQANAGLHQKLQELLNAHPEVLNNPRTSVSTIVCADSELPQVSTELSITQ